MADAYGRSSELGALDRCEHGRHAADSCWSCPGGQSSGNLFLTAGTRIGTTLYGEAIVVPESVRGETMSDCNRWTAEGNGVN